MYFSQQVLIKSWIFWSFSSISFLSAATLDRREIPEGLYHDCRGGALGEVCAGVIKEAWEAGRLKTFDGEHKFYTRSGTCKITYWTWVGVELLLHLTWLSYLLTAFNFQTQSPGLILMMLEANLLNSFWIVDCQSETGSTVDIDNIEQIQDAVSVSTLLSFTFINPYHRNLSKLTRCFHALYLISKSINFVNLRIYQWIGSILSLRSIVEYLLVKW